MKNNIRPRRIIIKNHTAYEETIIGKYLDDKGIEHTINIPTNQMAISLPDGWNPEKDEVTVMSKETGQELIKGILNSQEMTKTDPITGTTTKVTLPENWFSYLFSKDEKQTFNNLLGKKVTLEDGTEHTLEELTKPLASTEYVNKKITDDIIEAKDKRDSEIKNNMVPEINEGLDGVVDWTLNAIKDVCSDSNAGGTGISKTELDKLQAEADLVKNQATVSGSVASLTNLINGQIQNAHLASQVDLDQTQQDVNDIDHLIKANNKKVEDMKQDVDTLKTSQTTQDTDIATIKTGQAAQDTKISDNATELLDHESRITALYGANISGASVNMDATSWLLGEVLPEYPGKDTTKTLTVYNPLTYPGVYPGDGHDLSSDNTIVPSRIYKSTDNKYFLVDANKVVHTPLDLTITKAADAVWNSKFSANTTVKQAIEDNHDDIKTLTDNVGTQADTSTTNTVYGHINENKDAIGTIASLDPVIDKTGTSQAPGNLVGTVNVLNDKVASFEKYKIMTDDGTGTKTNKELDQTTTGSTVPPGKNLLTEDAIDNIINTEVDAAKAFLQNEITANEQKIGKSETTPGANDGSGIIDDIDKLKARPNTQLYVGDEHYDLNTINNPVNGDMARVGTVTWQYIEGSRSWEKVAEPVDLTPLETRVTADEVKITANENGIATNKGSIDANKQEFDTDKAAKDDFWTHLNTLLQKMLGEDGEGTKPTNPSNIISNRWPDIIKALEAHTTSIDALASGIAGSVIGDSAANAVDNFLTEFGGTNWPSLPSGENPVFLFIYKTKQNGSTGPEGLRTTMINYLVLKQYKDATPTDTSDHDRDAIIALLTNHNAGTVGSAFLPVDLTTRADVQTVAITSDKTTFTDFGPGGLEAGKNNPHTDTDKVLVTQGYVDKTDGETLGHAQVFASTMAFNAENQATTKSKTYADNEYGKVRVVRAKKSDYLGNAPVAPDTQGDDDTTTKTLKDMQRAQEVSASSKSFNRLASQGYVDYMVEKDGLKDVYKELLTGDTLEPNPAIPIKPFGGIKYAGDIEIGNGKTHGTFTIGSSGNKGPTDSFKMVAGSEEATFAEIIEATKVSPTPPLTIPTPPTGEVAGENGNLKPLGLWAMGTSGTKMPGLVNTWAVKDFFDKPEFKPKEIIQATIHCLVFNGNPCTINLNLYEDYRTPNVVRGTGWGSYQYANKQWLRGFYCTINKSANRIQIGFSNGVNTASGHFDPNLGYALDNNHPITIRFIGVK